MYSDRSLGVGVLIVLSFFIIGIVLLAFWAWPKYSVYKKELDGKAMLKEAQWSKKILIVEANAKETAALMQAKARVTLAKAEGEARLVKAESEGLADIARAKATAQANRIIGKSLKDNEAYLRYIWIQGLSDGNGERIYIPTEAGLPILEAGKVKY